MCEISLNKCVNMCVDMLTYEFKHVLNMRKCMCKHDET